ncbi:MAG: hypothetical protein D6683_08500 [Actinomyces sp.]|nr:MAG: hypothetical protein D6683_08500 [Actinomyces sp.]
MTSVGRPGRPLWTGSARGTLFVVLSAGLVAAAIVTAALTVVVGPWMLTMVPAFAVTAAVLAPFRRVTVTVTDEQVRVDFAGPWWPPIRLARERIRAVEVVDVRPWRHGGYGYRGSLRLFHRLAVVVRRGPGLRFELEPRGWLVVTVDRPDGALAAFGLPGPGRSTGPRGLRSPRRR